MKINLINFKSDGDKVDIQMKMGIDEMDILWKFILDNFEVKKEVEDE